MKIRADKDPFTALVQVLACAAHLATPHQYARLREFAPSGGFPQRDRPVLDGYILLYRFLEKAQADLARLAEQAEELSSRLMEHEQISGPLRRLACIDLSFDDGKLYGAGRWHHEAG